ncbi:MAG: pentapeptide repeat-containing protein [SAR324 cluster bacterium]|nr:pentapeptide repeat-containing protein [SAR324 cluster bacterium]MCZ6645851.1 pentapeptide repeat-containing protein [SAR324 cluster bacterium]
MQLTKEIFSKLKENVDFFQNFNDGELLALLKSTQREVFENSEIVFAEGTRGDKMYIIIAGSVRISRNIGRNQEEVLVTLESGVLFGEMGPIDQSPRSAKATAIGETILLSLRESILRQNSLGLAYKLYKNFSVMLAERLRNTNQRLTDLSVSDRDSSDRIRDLIQNRMKSGQGLKGTDLRGANLSETFMANADLKDSLLVGANLSGAKLTKANLQNCVLVNANLTGADLSGANLSGANFISADFSDANLSGANMQGGVFTAAENHDADMKPPAQLKKSS